MVLYYTVQIQLYVNMQKGFPFQVGEKMASKQCKQQG
jgi:hypothetical protein